MDLSSKRKRAAFDEDVSLAKQPRLHTHIIPSSTKSYTPPAPTRYTEPVKTISTPLSAPPAAGRSPTRIHSRLDKSQPRRRFAPPSLKSASPSISIAAALRGTLAHKRSVKSKKTAPVLEDAKPKSWFFDIYEESEEVQDYRMSEWTMTQSSAALEISDDESKSSCFHSRDKTDRGKENVDPNEMSVTTAPVTRAAAAVAAADAADQKESKDKEPRTPLGDLNAANFYAEGLDATSVVLVNDDSHLSTSTTEDVKEQPELSGSPAPAPARASLIDDSTCEAPVESQDVSELDLSNEPIPEWAQHASHNVDTENQQDDPFIFCDDTAEPAGIEIWESESAKDENENQEEPSRGGYVVIGEGQTISLSSGVCLQEI